MNCLTSKVERLINYVLIGIVLTIGILVLSGVFQIDPRIELPFGLVVVLYGLVRLGIMVGKQRRDENQKEHT